MASFDCTMPSAIVSVPLGRCQIQVYKTSPSAMSAITADARDRLATLKIAFAKASPGEERVVRWQRVSYQFARQAACVVRPSASAPEFTVRSASPHGLRASFVVRSPQMRACVSVGIRKFCSASANAYGSRKRTVQPLPPALDSQPVPPYLRIAPTVVRARHTKVKS